MTWRLWTKEGQLGPLVNHMTFLVRLSVCLFVTFYPHHQFNRAERHRREARRWEHPMTEFWPDDTDWALPAVRWRWPCDSNTYNVYIICFIYKGLRYHRRLLSVSGICWFFLQDIISFVWLVERRWEGFFHGNNCGVGLEAWELARSTLRTVRGWLPPTEEGVKLLAIFSFFTVI